MTVKAYLEHTAIYVKDIEWHINFFKEVFGMELDRQGQTAAGRKQVWTIGGVQFVHDPQFGAGEGRLAHLGIMTDDPAKAEELALANGAVTAQPGGKWISLPEGIVIELMLAAPGSVEQALAVKPRA